MSVNIEVSSGFRVLFCFGVFHFGLILVGFGFFGVFCLLLVLLTEVTKEHKT